MNLSIEVSKDGTASLIVFPAKLMKSLWVQGALERAVDKVRDQGAVLLLHIETMTNKGRVYEDTIKVDEKRALVQAINDITVE